MFIIDCGHVVLYFMESLAEDGAIVTEIVLVGDSDGGHFGRNHLARKRYVLFQQLYQGVFAVFAPSMRSDLLVQTLKHFFVEKQRVVVIGGNVLVELHQFLILLTHLVGSLTLLSHLIIARCLSSFDFESMMFVAYGQFLRVYTTHLLCLVTIISI